MSFVTETETNTQRLGGPVRSHARRSGRWFDPAPFAVLAAGLTMIIAVLRNAPCRPVDGHFPNAFLRTCYSDIPTLFISRGMATGKPIYGNFEYPAVTGYFVMLSRWITGLIAPIGPETTATEQFRGSVVFFLVCAVGLFVCFVALVMAHLLIGKNATSSDGVRDRSWDALWIAASPLVMLSGLVNWDLLVVALTSLGLLVWSRKRPVAAGVVLGLAFAAKFYPLLVIAAIVGLCLRAGKVREALQLVGTAAATWLLVNLPLMIFAFDGWKYFWTMNADRGADLGSIWYVLQLVGIKVPALSVIAAALMILGGLGVIWVIMSAPRRPRVAQIALLLMLVFLIFNKVYSPQYCLWLLPLVVLARPRWSDVVVWTVTESIYFFAIWGFLEGIIGPGSGSDWLYWVAVIIRVFGQIWLATRVIDDIMAPWGDPVRQPFIDDPLGGVLDHSVDAAWFTAAKQPGKSTERPAARPVSVASKSDDGPGFSE